jgi:drug/metabolite transporter (DMT)-like permease
VNAPEPSTASRGFRNPYVQLAIGAVLVTASELLLKKGASSTVSDVNGVTTVLGLGALRSVWTWLGIVLYVLSFFSWLYVLRLMPLAIAFALINVVHVLVPIGARIFLNEAISTQRWAGIALIIIGIALLARPAARAEVAL